MPVSLQHYTTRKRSSVCTFMSDVNCSVSSRWTPNMIYSPKHLTQDQLIVFCYCFLSFNGKTKRVIVNFTNDFTEQIIVFDRRFEVGVTDTTMDTSITSTKFPPTHYSLKLNEHSPKTCIIETVFINHDIPGMQN